LFTFVWSEAIKRWSSIVTMKSQVLSTLAFTRFICPMLINPVRHGLIEKQPSNDAMKVLIQISKSFQLVAVGWAESTPSPDLQKDERVGLTPEMIKKQYDTIEALFERIIELNKDVMEGLGSPVSTEKSNKKNKPLESPKPVLDPGPLLTFVMTKESILRPILAKDYPMVKNEANSEEPFKASIAVLSDLEKVEKLLEKEKSVEKPVEKLEKSDKGDKEKPERLSKKEKSKAEKSPSVDKSSSMDKSNSELDKIQEIVIDIPAALAGLTLDSLFDELNKIKDEEDSKRLGKPVASFSIFGRKLVLVKK